MNFAALASQGGHFVVVEPGSCVYALSSDQSRMQAVVVAMNDNTSIIE